MFLFSCCCAAKFSCPLNTTSPCTIHIYLAFRSWGTPGLTPVRLGRRLRQLWRRGRRAAAQLRAEVPGATPRASRAPGSSRLGPALRLLREPGGSSAVLCSGSGFRPVQGGVVENVPATWQERRRSRPQRARGSRGSAPGQAAVPGAQQGGARRWPESGGGGARTEAMRGRRRELTEEPVAVGRPDAALGRGRAEAESRGEPRALTAGGRRGGAGTFWKRLPRLEGAEHHGRGLPAPDFRPVMFRAACRKL